MSDDFPSPSEMIEAVIEVSEERRAVRTHPEVVRAVATAIRDGEEAQLGSERFSYIESAELVLGTLARHSKPLARYLSERWAFESDKEALVEAALLVVYPKEAENE